MVNYLNAELYKVTHRKTYTLVALAFILGGIVLLHFMFCNFTGEKQFMFEMAVKVLTMGMAVGPYLALMISDMVFSDQYKQNTLKNEMSYGLPRIRAYLGKLIAAAITAVVMCAIIVAFFLALSFALYPIEADLWESLRYLGKIMAASFPLWMGSLGLAFMLLFVTKGSTVATVIFVLVMGPLDSVLQLFQLFLENQTVIDGIQIVRDCLLGNGFNTLMMTGTMEMAASWKLGMAWFLISTVIGLVVFQKREIN